MKRWIGVLGIFAVWLGLATWASGDSITYPIPAGTPKFAVIVFIDGGHPELYTPDAAPHVTALARAGVLFTHAEVGFPSDSMPGILGALTGAPPRVTGIPYDIYYDRGRRQVIELTEVIRVPPGTKPHALLQVPTLFEAAKAKGLRTGFIAKHIGYEILAGRNGQAIDHLALPELADWKGTPADYDAANFATLRTWLAANVVDVAGIYVVAPNYVMKASGLSSAETAASVSAVDAQIGRLVDTLIAARRYDDTVLVIT